MIMPKAIINGFSHDELRSLLGRKTKMVCWRLPPLLVEKFNQKANEAGLKKAEAIRLMMELIVFEKLDLLQLRTL